VVKIQAYYILNKIRTGTGIYCIYQGIRIGNPDPGARKLRNFSGKMHFLELFLKKFDH
jgi:hypothetical protein